MKILFTFFILALTSLPSFASAKEITVTVNGMVCAFCAQGITRKLNAEPAVEKVDVSLEKKTVTVRLKEGKELGDQALETILKDSGYNVVKIVRQ